jgi:hypothetical protein
MTTSSNQSEFTATQFVDAELARAQKTLRRTRAIGIGSFLFVTGYMSFLTYTLQTKLLRPEPAAKFATACTSVLVQEQGEALSKQLVHDVPAYVRELPDLFLAQLPVVRGDLENRLDGALRTFANEISRQWGPQLDQYLASHRDEVLRVVADAGNPAVIEKFGENLEQQALHYLRAKGDDGHSAMDRCQQGLDALNTVEAQLERLARAKNLTPQEKTMRQLIAVTLQYTNDGV